MPCRTNRRDCSRVSSGSLSGSCRICGGTGVGWAAGLTRRAGVVTVFAAGATDRDARGVFPRCGARRCGTLCGGSAGSGCIKVLRTGGASALRTGGASALRIGAAAGAVVRGGGSCTAANTSRDAGSEAVTPTRHRVPGGAGTAPARAAGDGSPSMCS